MLLSRVSAIAALAVAAVSALVADRDWFRHRLAAYLRRHQLDDLGAPITDLMSSQIPERSDR